MIERWKDIPGYDGKYQASTEGNIRRTLKSGQFRSMTPYHKKMKGSQRLVVKLTKDGKAKEEIVLSLIARTFLGPVPDGAVPYHKNGMQSENHINNIAYIHRFYVWTRWKQVRQQVLKMDHNECQRCREHHRYTAATTVHHVNYVKRHPEMALDIWYEWHGVKKRNLISLCHECHEAVHGYRKPQKQEPLTEERWD